MEYNPQEGSDEKEPEGKILSLLWAYGQMVSHTVQEN